MLDLDIYIYIYLPLFVTLKKVYDRNVVNKYRIYFLLGVITFNLIDYIYLLYAFIAYIGILYICTLLVGS